LIAIQMKIDVFQVDAFTKDLFSGNPAAVCLLSDWLSDELMLSIAFENNLSETAFLNLSEDPIGIRWFSPKREVDLCGHATLASARILFDLTQFKNTEKIVFKSKRGLLMAKKEDDLIFLDFPLDNPLSVDQNPSKDLFGFESKEAYRGRDDYLFIFNSEEEIRAINPNYEKIKKLDSRGAIITARDSSGGIVSRCFYPKYGIDEDPVTGSAHTLIVPYWSSLFGSTKINARQLSDRGGQLFCEVIGDRVSIGGYTSVFFTGQIEI